jgi:hypothetical protein
MPVQKEITVQWGKWETASRYIYGFAELENYFVSLQYGKPLNQAQYDHSNAQECQRMLARWKSAIACTMAYGDPQLLDDQEMRHGGIKELVHVIVRDLHGGAQVEEKFDKVEIIESFLGSDAAALLNKGPKDMPTLRHWKPVL